LLSLQLLPTIRTLATMPECPTDDARITAYGMLIEAFAAVTHAVGRELERTAAMPTVWFEVLIRLVRSPEGRLRMSELAQQVQLSTSGLTRLVDRLEAKGYVRREACPGDRRGLNAVLTEEGKAAVDRTLPAHLDSLQRYVVDPLGGDVTTLTEQLRALRDNAGACPTSLPCS
jgi:MarR family 2-MHQ and catechol resistance regulon transcriptional repressor